MVRIILGGAALFAGVIISLRGGVILGGPIGVFGLGMLGEALRPRGQGGGAGQRGGTAPPRASNGMSVSEAREILGVAADADAESIRAAHRRLMKKLHPDTGEGSAALARQVQEARDVLLAQLDS
ncbi:DnaJ domain-containing protein [Maricaulis sp.]|uniref:J domain-containing protein n=1 Tax=Maricaulis sp. TaxID=1486257 RepID=UPI0025BE2695|nr:DnaJ domain-containing protein [Maricaulis sp.]